MKKVILSIDTGTDDAMAFACVLSSKELDLIGVVGTYDNVCTKRGVKNDLALLEMLGRKDIPVCLDDEHTIDKDDFEVSEVSADIHGQNGIGEVEVPAAVRQIETGDGVDFIIGNVEKYSKDLTVIATGSMTDLARTLKKYLASKNKVGQVVIVGGALTCTGNVTPYAEANIHRDPLATKILFESDTPATMVGLDITMRIPISLEDTQEWHGTKTVAGEKYADIMDYYIHVYNKYSPYLHDGNLHDPSATCAAIHPEWLTMLPLHMTVETEGETAGRTISIMEKLRESSPDVKVCINIEAEKVRQDICNTIHGLFTKQSGGPQWIKQKK